MKIQLHHILILTCTAMAVSMGPALAQDAGLPEVEIADPERDKTERDKILYSPGEADIRYVPKTTPPKDSASVNITQPPLRFKSEKTAPTPKNTVDKQSADKPKEEDDSILSFNFLYYIIQKYKLQDIVD